MNVYSPDCTDIRVMILTFYITIKSFNTVFLIHCKSTSDSCDLDLSAVLQNER